jgi:hypothetical protein
MMTGERGSVLREDLQGGKATSSCKAGNGSTGPQQVRARHEEHLR